MDIPQITAAEIAPLLPAIALSAGAIMLLFTEVFLASSSRGHQVLLAAATSLLGLFLSLAQAAEPARPIFRGLGVADPFSAGLSAVVCVGVLLATLFSAGFLRERQAERGEFYALLLFGGAGMSLLGMSAELITLFINLEVLSIATYALAAYFRRAQRSTEAGFKYFILGAFAAALFLYGAALIYGATGSTRLEDIAQRAAGASQSQPQLFYLGLLFLGAGFAFKVAAVPFHMWTPDVYEGAPTPVSGLMSAGVKAAAFVALIRVFLFVGHGVDAQVPFLLFGSLALFTMVGGNLLALPQRNVKRMLAYSSIAHAGYLLLGVTVLFAGPSPKAPSLLEATPLLPGAAASAQDVFKAVLFYLLAYTITSLGAFGTLSALERREDEDRGTAWDLERFTGLAQRRPGWAVAMAAFMLSLAGIPPTIGFVGKLLVFRAAVDAGLVALAVAGVLSSAVAVYYYLRVVVYMFMRPASSAEGPLKPHWTTELALVASAAAVVALGVLPQLLSPLVGAAAMVHGAR